MVPAVSLSPDVEIKPKSDNDDEDSNDDENSNDDEDSIKSDDETAPNDLKDSDKNLGWADSMNKILNSNKSKGKKSLVLSKAKKTSTLKKSSEAVDFEIIGDQKNIVEQVTVKEENEEPIVKKRKTDEERFPNLRVKPNILEREREKLLSKIATRGVVQLFNAVRNQQKDIEKKVEAVGPVQRKKEKVIKSLDKNEFLDKLMGHSKSELVNKTINSKSEPVKDEKGIKSTWNVLRDDFMMGAKMKDWNKKETEDNNDNEKTNSELSESDSE